VTFLSSFIFGETSIKEGSQRTARRSSHDSLQLAFVEPDPPTAPTAIQDKFHIGVAVQLTRALWTAQYPFFPPGGFNLLKFGFHPLDQFVFFHSKIAIFIGSLIELQLFSQAILVGRFPWLCSPKKTRLVGHGRNRVLPLESGILPWTFLKVRIRISFAPSCPG
jgi:hypothetical protein